MEDPTGEDLSRGDPDDPAKVNDPLAKDHKETDPGDPAAEDPANADDPTEEDPASEDPLAEDSANAEDPSDQTAVEENLENDFRSTKIGAAAIVITEAGKRIKAEAKYPLQNTAANITMFMTMKIYQELPSDIDISFIKN